MLTASTLHKKLQPLTHEWFHSRSFDKWWKGWVRYFTTQQPELRDDWKTGIVMYHLPNGAIVPAGITFLDKDRNFVFWYHEDYVVDPALPAISRTLPKRRSPYITQDIHPFFDNLEAEGWLDIAQGIATGQVEHSVLENDSAHAKIGTLELLPENFSFLESRYHRLMMFGRDCHGAISVTYAHPDPRMREIHSELIADALRSRGTIGGMQPKFLGIVDPETHELRAARYGETSTYIVKLPGSSLSRIKAEYMSTVATQALLPDDQTAEVALCPLPALNKRNYPVLAIKRFDRKNNCRRPFEEMAQLMEKQAINRCDGLYSDVAAVLEELGGKRLVKQFYARLLAQFVLGNGDSHLKNFALYQDSLGQWQFTPNYDLMPSVDFRRTKREAALSLNITRQKYGGDFFYKNLNPKTIIQLGQSFGLSLEEIRTTVHELRKHKENAKASVIADDNEFLRAS